MDGVIDSVGMSERERLEELRRFLKDRRARVSPADVGLPTSLRRRVRGLRREEVASLAGIGVSWYTALENGDARGVSDATLLAVASALRLSDSEREYVFALAGRSGAIARYVEPAPLVVEAMKALQFPAYVITATWEVVAFNAAFQAVWSIEEGELPFNAVERLFVNPAARKMHGDHFAANIAPVVAMLHSSLGRQPHVENLRRLRDMLLADDVIQKIWNDYEISSPLLPNACTIESPIGRFHYETLTLPVPNKSHAIVVQVPDAESYELLDRAATGGIQTLFTSGP
jgi:transcriptional regulator with XRE-family HTH domain